MQDPNHANNVNTHGTWTVWPATQMHADPGCVSLLHANMLFRWRDVHIRNTTQPEHYTWAWPGVPEQRDVESDD